jgi:hypothetical protein
MVLRVCLDALEKTKIFCTCRESNPSRLARSYTELPSVSTLPIYRIIVSNGRTEETGMEIEDVGNGLHLPGGIEENLERSQAGRCLSREFPKCESIMLPPSQPVRFFIQFLLLNPITCLALLFQKKVCCINEIGTRNYMSAHVLNRLLFTALTVTISR